MYSLKNLFQKNPVQISGVVVSAMSLAQIFDLVDLTGDEVAAVGSFTVLFLGLFIVSTTTNTAKLEEAAAAVQIEQDKGFDLATGMAELESSIPAHVAVALAGGNGASGAPADAGTLDSGDLPGDADEVQA